MFAYSSWFVLLPTILFASVHHSHAMSYIVLHCNHVCHSIPFRLTGQIIINYSLTYLFTSKLCSTFPCIWPMHICTARYVFRLNYIWKSARDYLHTQPKLVIWYMLKINSFLHDLRSKCYLANMRRNEYSSWWGKWWPHSRYHLTKCNEQENVMLQSDIFCNIALVSWAWQKKRA